MFFGIAGYIPLFVIELLLDVSYAVDKVMTIESWFWYQAYIEFGLYYLAEPSYYGGIDATLHYGGF